MQYHMQLYSKKKKTYKLDSKQTEDNVKIYI